MSRSIRTMSNFAAGEVSPLLQTRTDFIRRRTGVERANGFLPSPEGALQRSPGTVHWGYTRANDAVRLIPFEFNSTDAVVLEFYADIMRVRRYGELVLVSGSPFEMAHPYDAAAIARLTYVQSADVIYLADGVLPMQRLSRLALDNWTITAVQSDTGPFRAQNTDKTKKITASAATGTITLTADFDIFTAAHVGSLLRLEIEVWKSVPLWQLGQSMTPDIRRMRNDGRVYECLHGTSGKEPPNHSEGIERTSADPFVQWEFISDNNGVARITAVAGPQTATATVIKRMPEVDYVSPNFLTAPTYRWAEGAWSGVYGYPAILALHQQRLFAARTASEPRTLWASSIGNYQDHTPGTSAEDAFGVIIDGDGSMNPIVWMESGARALHIGAQAEEYSLTPVSEGSGVAIANIRIARDSAVGSIPAQPVTPAGAPLFISRDGRKLFELSYQMDVDAVVPRDMTLPARHLGADPFAAIVWQGDPVSLIWARRQSGDLVAFRYSRGEDLQGWATVSLAGGVCENMAVTRAISDQSALLVLAVRRTIAAVERRSIEVLAAPPGWDFMPPGDVAATHLFCASVQTVETPASSFGVPHLAGQAVTIWADNQDHGTRVVAGDGTLTLDYPVSRMEAGLFDDTHMVDLFDIAAADDGDMPVSARRLEAAPTLHVFATQQASIQTISRSFGAAPILSNPALLVPPSVADNGIAPSTGALRPALAGVFSRDAGLRIKPVSGAALTVLAVSAIAEKGPA